MRSNSDPFDSTLTPGQRIRAYRVRSGRTQEMVSALMGHGPSWLRHIEADRAQLRLRDYVELAEILGVQDPYSLIGRPASLAPDPGVIYTQIHTIAISMYRTHEGRPIPNLAARVEQAWDMWHTAGNMRYAQTGSMLPGLINDTEAAARAAVDAPARRNANRTLALMYMLVRDFTKRIDAKDLSLVAADRSISAARLAEDRVAEAAAAWNLAQILCTQTQYEESMVVALEGMNELQADRSDLDTEALGILGALHLIGAISAVRAGDTDRAKDLVDEADRIAARTGEGNPWRTVFGPTNVALHRASVLMESGKYAASVAASERIDSSVMPSVDRRLVHYIDTAWSYLQTRSDAAAIHILLKAEELSNEELHYGIKPRLMIRELKARDANSIRDEVAELARRMGLGS